ncbi:MAG: MG2 domain-containing protein [Leptospirales bacterium]
MKTVWKFIHSIYKRFLSITGNLRGMKASLKAGITTLLVVTVAVFTFVFSDNLGAQKSPGYLTDSGSSSNAAEEQPVTNDNTLVVTQGTPRGKLSSADIRREIIVMFNYPMVPLATLKKVPKGIFTIEPHIKGTFRWYGSRVCAFVPKESFQPATNYTITIAEGVKALNGKQLEKPYVFTFSTEKLKVQKVYAGYNNKIRYDQVFDIKFNFPVDVKEAEKYITLSSRRTKYTFKTTYRDTIESSNLSSDEIARKKQTLRVQAIKPFGRDELITLRISKNLKPMGGKIGLSKDYRKDFQTYGPLRVDFSKGKGKYFSDLYHYRLEFNNPVNFQDLRKAIKFEPEAPSYRDQKYKSTRFPMTQWKLKPSTKYTITFPKGLKDAYGNSLQDPKTKYTFTTPARRKSFYTDQGFFTIESTMAHFVPVRITGLKELQVAITPFSEQDLLDYASLTKYRSTLNLTYPEYLIWNLGLGENDQVVKAYDLSPFSKKRPGWFGIKFESENSEKATRRYGNYKYVQITDLGLMVKESALFSDIWVHSFSTGKAIEEASVNMYEGDTLLNNCKTDKYGYCRIPNKIIPGYGRKKQKISYIVKNGPDKAFVMDNHNRVGMWGISPNFNYYAHQPVLSGIVVFDRKLYRPGDTVSIKAFLGIRKDGLLYYTTKALGSVAAVITDSRGQEVKDVTLEATKEGGANLSYKINSDAPLGHYRIEFYSDALGETSYSNSSFISDTFQVEEFRPVSFSVNSKGLDNSFIDDKKFLTIEGKYLFGAPMQNAPYEYSLSRKPLNVYVETYSQYLFGDDDYGDRWESSGWSYYTGGSGKLGKTGLAEFNFNLPKLAPHGLEKDDLSRHYKLQLEAKVSDIDDKNVSHKKSVTVYAGKILPGIKTLDRYQNRKEQFEFDLIALSNNKFSPAKISGEVIIHKKEWHSIKTKGAGESSQRKNRLVRIEVSRKKITVGAKPYRFKTTVKESGNYTITFKVDDSRAFARTNFYAFGGEYIGWDFHEDDTITLMPDKNEYKPGETAKILIQSPIKKSTAIVSVERENVIWQKSYELEGNGEPIEVKIEEGFIPNVYLSVVLLRPRMKSEKIEKGKDLGRPVFKVGIVKLKVNTSAYKLPLTIKTNREIYGPGDAVSIHIKTEPGAEVAVSVADRAVLDLVNYYFPDPVKTFYDNWPHGVFLVENRRSIIEQLNYSNKGDSPGGKGKQANMQGNGGFRDEAEDGTRKEFLHTAYWTSKKIADNKGNININFTLPHNLTTFRIQALGAKKGKYSSSSREFKVQKPIVLQTSLPRFIRPGDRLQMGAVVVNQSGRDGKFKVTFESDLLKSADKKSSNTNRFEKIVSIQNGESVETSFAVQVDDAKYIAKKKIIQKKYIENFGRNDEDEPDYDTFFASQIKGKVKVEAVSPEDFKSLGLEAKDLKDGMAFKLPVREIPPREAFTIAGYTEQGEQEMITIPETGTVSPYYGGLELELSSTALVGLDRGFSFFQSNPYFCLEQRASAFLLALTSGQLLKEFGQEPPQSDAYDFQKIGNIFINDLSKFQNSDGGFKLWKNSYSKRSNPYLTAHVVFVLQTMRETSSTSLGSYKFPKAIYNRAIQYLEWYILASHRDQHRYLYETRAYINYILARDGKGNRMLERTFMKKREQLSLRSQAYLALAISLRTGENDYRKNSDLKKLFEFFNNRMQITTKKVFFDEPVYGSYNRTWYSQGGTLSAILRAYMALDEKNSLIPKMIRASIGQESHRLWGNSHSSGLLAYALWRYHRKYEDPEAKFTAVAAIGKKDIFTNKFVRLVEPVVSKTVTMKNLFTMGEPGEKYPLSFQVKKGEGRLYYTGTLLYSPLKYTEKARDEGIEIRREIFPLSPDDIRQGNTVKTFVRGKAYLYRLTVINPKPVYYFVLTDPLPANVEVVNTGFQTESAIFSRVLEKQRQSSGSDYWWMQSKAVYEYRDDRVLIFLDYLEPGIHEYFYIGRGIVKGKSISPAAEAFGMYEPERFGRTGVGLHTIK